MVRSKLEQKLVMLSEILVVNQTQIKLKVVQHYKHIIHPIMVFQVRLKKLLLILEQLYKELEILQAGLLLRLGLHHKC